MATAPVRVLIVDDEPDILDVLTDILSGLRYEISTATNGAEALSIVRMAKPDVVLLDLTLPVMSGRETLQHLHDEFPEIPVLIVAAQMNAAVEQEVLALGALRYISKPFRLDEIRQVVEAAVARRREP